MHVSLDLNLLTALDALLREGSVAGAARRMNLSAPAMSRTLARIREATGDPVLVRAGRGLVPSPRAEAMREEVRSVVEAAAGLLRPQAPASPRDFDRSFTIQGSDNVTWVLGPRLMADVEAEAPGVSLCFVQGGGSEALREGRADLEVSVHPPTGPEIRTQLLYRDAFVGLVHREHPLAGRKLTPRRFAAATHVVTSRRGLTRGPVDARLEALGLSRRVLAVVPSFLAAAGMAAATGAVAMVPRRFAEAAARVLDVTALELPFELEPLAVSQAWHPRHEADPAHRWLRDAVRRAAGN